MHNEAEFLKYLDKELSKEEAEEFERMLANQPDQRKLLEEIAKKRQHSLDALEMLNPGDEQDIPAFEDFIHNSKPSARKPFLFISKFQRYAAVILILASIAVASVLYNRREANQQRALVSEMTNENQNNGEFKELDEYISPNRCWNKRELVWTIVEKKK